MISIHLVEYIIYGTIVIVSVLLEVDYCLPGALPLESSRSFSQLDTRFAVLYGQSETALRLLTLKKFSGSRGINIIAILWVDKVSRGTGTMKFSRVKFQRKKTDFVNIFYGNKIILKGNKIKISRTKQWRLDFEFDFLEDIE